ncbi:MAG: class I SAM-dependent methyltransferase [Gemmatimonadaceae bacterium]
MPIRHISDTARWVAFYRAMESERPDALFVDPWARRLAGAKGEEIVRTLKHGQSSAWAMIVRTAVFDEIILRLVQRNSVDLVVNLAAGLDTRPFRLALPPALRWTDVDLPDILEYKRETLAGIKPHCVYEAITTDLTDADARRALFARLGGSAKRALVVTEGLLIYLHPEQVGALADDLHAQPAFHWWLIDIASPWLKKYMQRTWDKTLDAGNSRMHFFPEEGTAFFRPHGWKQTEYRSSVEEAHRLRREMKLAWLWRFMMRMAPAERREAQRKISGAALLERAGVAER